MKRFVAILLVLVFFGFCFVAIGRAIESNVVEQSAQKSNQTLGQKNVILHLVAREALFFSAYSGVWISVRLELGERVLRRKASSNVALVVTNKRAVGFSGVLSNVAEVSLNIGSETDVEAVETEGNVASVLTNRKAYGFSAFTGRWAETDRFQPR